MSRQELKLDLLFASSGIERKIVERASAVKLPHAGEVPIAAAEELLAMKVRKRGREEALNGQLAG